MKNKLKSNLSDIIRNFTPLRSESERIQKLLTNSFNGLNDPENGSHISRLTDLSSLNCLRWIKLKMDETEEGKRILTDKPRITNQSIDFPNLKNLQTDTLGYQYYKYMSENNFTPDERPVAEFIPDLELAYVCQRYKETHDFYHVLLNLGRSVREEVAIKWFEALHLRLPSSSIAALFGPLRMSPSETFRLYSNLLPEVIENGNKAKFLLGVYYEERLNQNIDQLRQELNIKPLINKF